MALGEKIGSQCVSDANLFVAMGLQRNSLGADIFALQATGLAVGGPLAMVGFLQPTVWFGHGPYSPILSGHPGIKESSKLPTTGAFAKANARSRIDWATVFLICSRP
jgi:hypothetical protein